MCMCQCMCAGVCVWVWKWPLISIQYTIRETIPGGDYFAVHFRLKSSSSIINLEDWAFQSERVQILNLLMLHRMWKCENQMLVLFTFGLYERSYSHNYKALNRAEKFHTIISVYYTFIVFTFCSQSNRFHLFWLLIRIWTSKLSTLLWK